MDKPGLIAQAANFAPGFFQVRRRTWFAAGIGLLVFIGLLIWAALALVSWLWGQTQSLAGAAPDALRGTTNMLLEQVKGIVPGAQGVLDQARQSVPGAQNVINQVKERVPAAKGVLDQVTESVPGAREMLAGLVPALKPETAPQRDVSGEDLGPVARYPGLTRSQWQRAIGPGAAATVEFEGKADYVKVLDYYAKEFAAKGFTQALQTSTLETETHEYTKGSERFLLKIAQKPKGGTVSVRIERAKP
ncbi:MAG: hypothetical protein JNM42_02755 [Propionivibrio sp.]|uniref:hypothetical protein n=1 Tax=Propionivibrio sp. TaxID=2212460 RepID=UPI001A61FFAE|nr:hypothetical protein [Propionivibrio sp.]MBL8413338.1 hypothetical protein [Propionivibrio sp.]